METTNYTFSCWNDSEMAAGFDSSPNKGRRTALTCGAERSGRGPGRDNVIDLAAWRMENLERSQDDLEEPDWEPVIPARRVRKSHRAMLIAELASTISVAAILAALMIWVLVF